MYIALEGIDTAGKSTQIEKLKAAFPNAVFTKEPGATEAGKQIRSLLLEGTLQSPKAEFLLFLADRAEHLHVVIKPHRHELVISDRSVVSGVAYALSAQTLDTQSILELNRFATDAIFPDIVFLLELTPKELSHRLSLKELDGIEARGTDYLLDIQNHLKEASKLLGIPCVVIDATQPIDAIAETIISTIKAHTHS